MTVLELAKKYYPRLGGRERIEALEAAGRLTAEQTEEIFSPVFDEKAEQGKEQEGPECLDTKTAD